MVLFQQFNFNQKEGFLGLIFLSLSISLLCFSIAYVSEAFSWIGESSRIAGNWFIGTSILLLLGIIFGISSVILLKKAKYQKEKSQKTIRTFDLNQPKGIIGLITIPTGIIFAINAAIYRGESIRWQLAIYNRPELWYLKEAAAWNNAALIIGFISIALICGGAFLLVTQV